MLIFCGSQQSSLKNCCTIQKILRYFVKKNKNYLILYFVSQSFIKRFLKHQDFVHCDFYYPNDKG